MGQPNGEGRERAFKCPRCEHTWRTSFEALRARPECPACGERLRVPAARRQPSAAPVERPAAAPSKPGPPVPPVEASERRGSAGALAGDCVAAFLYALRALPQIVVILLIYAVFAIPAVGVGVLLCLGGLSSTPVILLIVIAVLVGLPVLGYLLRYHLAVLATTMDGETDPPPRPKWAYGEQMRVGLLGMGMGMVYAVPILTLPLAPIGWLFFARTTDGRGCSLFRAARASLLQPGRYLLLLGFLLVWCAVMWLAQWAVEFATGFTMGYLGAEFGAVMALNDYLIMAVVGSMGFLIHQALSLLLGVTIARATGRFGFHQPEVLDLVPARPNAGITAAYAVASMAVTVALAVALAVVLAEPLKNWAVRRQQQQAAEAGKRAEQLLVEARQHAETLAKELRAYLATHDYNPPGSLEALGKARKLTLEQLRSPGDPRRRYAVGPASDPQVDPDRCFLYDPTLYHGGKVLLIDGFGVFREVSADSLEEVLRACRGRHPLRRRDTDERLVAYGDPPKLFVRRTYASGDSTFVRARKTLGNLGADLLAYAAFHGDKFPPSLDDLRAGGLVPDARDLQSAGDPSKRVVYAPPPDLRPRTVMGIPSRLEAPRLPSETIDTVLAYDPTPCDRDQKSPSFFIVLHANGVDISQIMPLEAFEEMRYTPLTKRVLLLPKRQDGRPARAAILYRRKLSGNRASRAETNMRNLFSDILAYSAAHDGNYPKSLQELRDSGFLPGEEDLRTPGNPQLGYVYIPGQRFGSNVGNILLYDPTPYKTLDFPETILALVPGRGVCRYDNLEAVRRRIRSQTPSGPELTMTFAKADLLPKGGAAGGSRQDRRKLPRLPPKETPGEIWKKLPEARLLPEYPLREVCQVLKRVDTDDGAAAIGVAFGAACGGQTDPTFLSFQKLLNAHRARVTFREPRTSGHVAVDNRWHPGPVDKVRGYQRWYFTRGGLALVLMAGIQDGRCVAYWFCGDKPCLPWFDAVLGGAPSVAASPAGDGTTVRCLTPAMSEEEANLFRRRDKWTNWPDVRLDRTHKLFGICSMMRRFTVRQSQALGGVAFGPEAQSTKDAVFAAFKDRTLKRFWGMWPRPKSSRKRPRPVQRLFGGGRTYYTAAYVSAVTKEHAQVTISVEDGVCVAYWFLGHYNCLALFSNHIAERIRPPRKVAHHRDGRAKPTPGVRVGFGSLSAGHVSPTASTTPAG